MRIAVIGTGKTGSEVIKQLPEDQLHSTFNANTPISEKKLKGADIAIIFTPGSSVEELIPTLINAQLPAIWGTTGFEWPSNINTTLITANLCWVHGSNFSLGMVVMKKVIEQAGSLVKLLKNPTFHLVESHHSEKVDTPSGTALSWESWFGHSLEIESIRSGDIIGNHRLEIETESDIMLFEHKAKSRQIFAEGAIWAAQQVVNNSFYNPGLHLFEQMMESKIKEINLCQS
jgi:4-hydroxy-tetrahydrodipicolinate reductase